MKKTWLISLVILNLLSCSAQNGMMEPPSLPTHVDNASDASIIKMQEKLKADGVRVISMGQMYLVSIPSGLLFPDESPRLLWGSYGVLNDVVCYLQQFRKVSLHVDAYSSPHVSSPREHALTLARAKIVADYLWSQNVDSRFIFTEGFGSEKPIVLLSKCNDSSPNSRVEITFRRAII